MSKNGPLSVILRGVLACGMTIVLSTVPGCSDPEVGSMPKMKKSKEDTLKELDGPERVVKKKARAK